MAPGAGLAYCGPNTFVEYTSCLSQLVAAGATILVDDVIFPQEDLLSSDGSAVQAVEQILAQNPSVALFTAEGNYNGSYWEGNYSPVALSSLGLPPLTCPSNGATQTDYYVAEFDGTPSQLLTVYSINEHPRWRLRGQIRPAITPASSMCTGLTAATVRSPAVCPTGSATDTQIVGK